MVFKQLRIEELGVASYLIGCRRADAAVIVDPAADCDLYLGETGRLGLRVAGVLETHIHADFVSCARELARRAGAPHHLHRAAAVGVVYDFAPLDDGDVLEFGDVAVSVLHTPGHTPEHACYVVTDRGRTEEPWFVLTGDSLGVDGVGHPDLLVGAQAAEHTSVAERATQQYRSITERLFALAGHVEVFPTHYDLPCGKPSSTIAFERHHNPALQHDGQAFVRALAERVAPFPAAHRRIKAVNLGLAEARAPAGGSVLMPGADRL